MKKEKIEKIADKALEEFDFKKVLKIQKLLGWKYAKFSLTIENLKKFVRSLIKTLLEEKHEFIESGGFRVEYNKEEKDLRILFVAVECWIGTRKSDL